MQAGPSRLAGKLVNCSRNFSGRSHSQTLTDRLEAKKAAEVAQRVSPRPAALGPLVTATDGLSSPQMLSPLLVGESAAAPPAGPASSTASKASGGQQQRTRSGPQQSSPAYPTSVPERSSPISVPELSYPTIMPELPFIRRSTESERSRERTSFLRKTAAKLKDDWLSAQMSPPGGLAFPPSRPVTKSDTGNWPPLPTAEDRIVPATASSPEMVVWPSLPNDQDGAKLIARSDPALLVHVKNLPEMSRTTEFLVTQLRGSGVLVSAMELDLEGLKGRILCHSAFDVQKLLALTKGTSHGSELFYWSDYAGAGELIDRTAHHSEVDLSMSNGKPNGSLLTVSCNNNSARSWQRFSIEPSRLQKELERKWPFRFRYHVFNPPSPRDSGQPLENVIRIEVYPRDLQFPVSKIVHGLHGRALDAKTHIYVSETSLQPRTSISIDASLSTLRQPSSSQRAILVSGLPREMTASELKAIFVDQLKLAIDSVWQHSVANLHPSTPATAVVYTQDDETYQRMLLISGRLSMRGVPIGFIDMCYPSTANGPPPPDALGSGNRTGDGRLLRAVAA